MECFEIKNLSFLYPGEENKVLDNIRLSVKKGEFLTICGKSGCGKTTLLRHLKPALLPVGERTGEIFFNGQRLEEIHPKDAALKIGFVQQSPDAMIVTDKVWHEMAFGLENMGISSDEIRLRVAEISTFFGLQGIFHKLVSELSGGQKQLLNLASVMVMNPDVLILDEPTSQMDPIAAQEFLSALKRVNMEFGVTIIISEHRTEEVFAISDRVALMECGKLKLVMPPQKFGTVLKQCEALPMLPTAMRVFSAVSEGENCPVTVAQGSMWLAKAVKTREIKMQKEKEERPKSEPVIRVKEVFFKYKKEQPDVLSDLSVDICCGEIFGIVGGNGVGKSTLLALMCGLKKPYRGRVLVDKNCKIAMLPQNPDCMFLKKSIFLDLLDMLEKSDMTENEKEEKVFEVAKICEIEHIINRHPFDVSGGEIQRAALAKILLLNPDVILFDEPTKGMDAFFKKKFGDILVRLKQKGKTMVVVSHDIEFCAEFTDRCGMLFDARIVNVGESRRFFAGNRFYTTAANRMARNLIPDAVLVKDIVFALGGEPDKKAEREFIDKVAAKKEDPSKEKTEGKNRKSSWYMPCFGVAFAVLFALTQRKLADYLSGWKNILAQIATIIFATAAVWCFLPGRLKRKEVLIKKSAETKRAFAIKTVIGIVLTAIAVVATVFWGMLCLDDQKYFLISILIILEIFASFFIFFESRRPQASELVIISVLCAVGIAGRIVFAAIPQFKPMLAVIIIAGVCLGGERGFLVGAICGFVSNFYFGQGPWTPWQMLALGMVGLVSGIFFYRGVLPRTRLSLCLFGGIATIVIYGGIINPSSIVLMKQPFSLELMLSYYIAGFPFDFLHGIATAAFLWLGCVPVIEKLERVKTKYGIMK